MVIEAVPEETPSDGNNDRGHVVHRLAHREAGGHLPWPDDSAEIGTDPNPERKQDVIDNPERFQDQEIMGKGVTGESQSERSVVKRHSSPLPESVDQPPDRGGDQQGSDGVYEH